MSHIEAYDEEVMKMIFNEYSEEGASSEEASEVEPSEPRVTKAKVELGDSELWFSEVFWKPLSIPDFPVPSFTQEDWDEEVRGFIPAVDKPDSIFYSWPKKETEIFVSSVIRGDNRCLLHGPTGTGKTTLPEMVCAKLCIPFIRVSAFQEMKASHYIGKDTVKVNPETGTQEVVYEPSNLVFACMHGAMLVLDEANRAPPAIAMSIQPLMERHGTLSLQDAAGIAPSDRLLRPPKGKFWLVATDNTNGLGDSSGNYSAEVQDLSTLDRITSSIYIDYLPSKAEAGILSQAYPDLNDDTAGDMVRVAKYIRDAFTDHKVLQTMSPRALMSWASHAVMYENVELAFEVAFFNKLDDDCKAVVREVYHQVMAVNLPA